MAYILLNNRPFQETAFNNEEELEDAVVANKQFIFGPNVVLIDYKRKTGSKLSRNTGIPDGFLLDFTNPKKPQFFFVEYELESHELYDHIGPQIMRFYASFETSKRELQKKLLDVIKNDQKLKEDIQQKISITNFDNIDSLLNYVLFDQSVGMVVVIDDQTEDFNSLLRRFSEAPEVVTIKKFESENETAYHYSTFREGIAESTIVNSKKKTDDKAWDLIVCPAREEGFKHAFLNNDSWWAIRISSGIIPQL